MSYKTLTEQYNYKLKKKISNYVYFELAGLEIEFENYFNIFSKKTNQDGYEKKVCTGITKKGMLTGKDQKGNITNFNLNVINTEQLSYLLDQLLELNYKVLNFYPNQSLEKNIETIKKRES